MTSTLCVEFITMIFTILIRIKDFRIFAAAPQIFHFCYFCFQTFGGISIIIPSKFTIWFAWTLRILVVTFFNLISCFIIPRQKPFLTIAFAYKKERKNPQSYSGQRIFVNWSVPNVIHFGRKSQFGSNQFILVLTISFWS